MVSAGGFAVGVLMGLLAGLLNGIFLLPMRYARKWAWENVWLFFSILSTILFPWVAAWVAVPHLFDIFRSVSLSAFVPGVMAGLVWGVAQVMYGLGCGMVGIAIGSAVIGCTAIIAGTLGPLIVYAPSKLFSSSSLVLLVATLLIIAGIYMYGKAGASKERETAGTDAEADCERVVSRGTHDLFDLRRAGYGFHLRREVEHGDCWKPRRPPAPRLSWRFTSPTSSLLTRALCPASSFRFISSRRIGRDLISLPAAPFCGI